MSREMIPLEKSILAQAMMESLEEKFARYSEEMLYQYIDWKMPVVTKVKRLGKITPRTEIRKLVVKEDWVRSFLRGYQVEKSSSPRPSRIGEQYE